MLRLGRVFEFEIRKILGAQLSRNVPLMWSSFAGEDEVLFAPLVSSAEDGGQR
jgi:hypothetical protein